tara:strand:+ start:37 stop:213 length:177 start_codon:yes stop_codon:yes gene_type:complete
MSYIKYHFSNWKGEMKEKVEDENPSSKQYTVTPTTPTTYITNSSEHKVYADIHNKEVK